MDELERAWQNLDMNEYINTLHDFDDVLYSMRIFDYQRELIAILDERSKLEILPHFADGMFWGFNVYSRTAGRLDLIDTFDTKEEGELLISLLRAAMERWEPVFHVPYQLLKGVADGK